MLEEHCARSLKFQLSLLSASDSLYSETSDTSLLCASVFPSLKWARRNIFEWSDQMY